MTANDDIQDATFVPSCANCRFMRPLGDELRCHRHAPAVSIRRWPFVLPGDWCGDHE